MCIALVEHALFEGWFGLVARGPTVFHLKTATDASAVRFDIDGIKNPYGPEYLDRLRVIRE